MSGEIVQPIERLDLAFSPKPWAFAEQRRAEIDAHFAALRARKPKIWNGRVLLLHDHSIDQGVLHGAFLETDFASFAAWRDWGQPEAGVRDCFGAAAVCASDGGFLLGVMAAHTMNAGWTYFPCGTPDRSDISGDRVDFDLSVRRELIEETGLDPVQLSVDPGWILVGNASQLALFRTMRSPQTAGDLRASVMGHLSSQSEPELADLRLVRSAGDLDATVPDVVRAFLMQRWR